jgi:uncharacterized protein YwgA
LTVSFGQLQSQSYAANKVLEEFGLTRDLIQAAESDSKKRRRVIEAVFKKVKEDLELVSENIAHKQAAFEAEEKLMKIRSMVPLAVTSLSG